MQPRPNDLDPVLLKIFREFERRLDGPPTEAELQRIEAELDEEQYWALTEELRKSQKRRDNKKATERRLTPRLTPAELNARPRPRKTAKAARRPFVVRNSRFIATVPKSRKVTKPEDARRRLNQELRKRRSERIEADREARLLAEHDALEAQKRFESNKPQIEE